MVRHPILLVIPAQAGIQLSIVVRKSWIPACAGLRRQDAGANSEAGPEGELRTQRVMTSEGAGAKVRKGLIQTSKGEQGASEEREFRPFLGQNAALEPRLRPRMATNPDDLRSLDVYPSI
jgi:hypothetical protein